MFQILIYRILSLHFSCVGATDIQHLDIQSETIEQLQAGSDLKKMNH